MIAPSERAPRGKCTDDVLEHVQLSEPREKNISCYGEVFCPLSKKKSFDCTLRAILRCKEERKWMEDMTLREVCTALGVSRRAVQGYENESLVTATGKNNRGYLLYNSEAQERIKKIKLYQDMGFSRKQIKEIIDDSGSVLRNALIQQKEKLNQEIEQKTYMIHIIQEILDGLP